jgi:hypothetical protein
MAESNKGNRTIKDGAKFLHWRSRKNLLTNPRGRIRTHLARIHAALSLIHCRACPIDGVKSA